MNPVVFLNPEYTVATQSVFYLYNGKRRNKREEKYKVNISKSVFCFSCLANISRADLKQVIKQ